MGMIIGVMTLFSAVPNIQGIVKARAMAVQIFEVLERTPKITNPTTTPSVVKLNQQISFDDVTFRYPLSLPTAPNVLTKASFTIPANTSTAIVGPSGAGKSTIV